MGRPKKITPDINYVIASLHSQNYSLSGIKRYLYEYKNITLSRTAIKYTIDADDAIRWRLTHLIMVTGEQPEIPRMPRIIMAPPGLHPSNTPNPEKIIVVDMSGLKKNKVLIEHENVNSGDSNDRVDSRVRGKNK